VIFNSILIGFIFDVDRILLPATYLNQNKGVAHESRSN